MTLGAYAKGTDTGPRRRASRACRASRRSSRRTRGDERSRCHPRGAGRGREVAGCSCYPALRARWRTDRPSSGRPALRLRRRHALRERHLLPRARRPRRRSSLRTGAARRRSCASSAGSSSPTGVVGAPARRLPSAITGSRTRSPRRATCSARSSPAFARWSRCATSSPRPARRRRAATRRGARAPGRASTDRYHLARGDELEHKVAALASHLGFSDRDLERPVASLSGGERGRLRLGVVARAAARRPPARRADQPPRPRHDRLARELARRLPRRRARRQPRPRVPRQHVPHDDGARPPELPRLPAAVLRVRRRPRRGPRARARARRAAAGA